MKKFVLILLVLGSMSVRAADPPEKVKQFYDNLMLLGRSDKNEATRALDNMRRCFYENIDILMDGNEEEITAHLYIVKLNNSINENHTLKVVSYSIEGIKALEQPDQHGSEKTHQETYITKTYIRDGQTFVYRDHVWTENSNGLITTMGTETRGGLMSFIRPSARINIEQLRACAAYYYTEKRYEDAYECYELIVKNRPNDGDAAYRLALMTFWRKGCKQRFSKREAEELAHQYIEKAILYGSNDVSVRARRVQANWNRGNIYF